MFWKPLYPALVWAGIILILTLSPWIPTLPAGPWNFSGIDLVVHTVVFGFQCFLLIRGFSRQQKYPLYRDRSASLAMTYTTLFGIFIEILQYYIPNRSMEYFDILADILGAIAGYGTFRLYDRYYSNQ